MSNCKTDIAAIRKSAKVLLYIDIMPTASPLVASHSFTNTYITAFRGEGNTFEMIDLHETDSVGKWRAEMEKLIEKSNLFEVLMLMNKPYVLYFLYLNKKNISDIDLGKSLAMMWTAIENISTDVNVSGRELVSLFKRANKEYLMDEEERKIIQSIGSEVTLYRGVTEYNRKHRKALSWTRDYEKAKWFATRFGLDGEIWKITVPRERVLACFEQRGESEVILNLYDAAFPVEKEFVKGERSQERNVNGGGV